MTSQQPTAGGPTASAGAELIRERFDRWSTEFHALTARARQRFERREWRDGQRDSVERLALYERAVQASVADLNALFGSAETARPAWADLKERFRSDVADRGDLELALTFFSSSARRFFGTVGVEPGLEFLEVPSLPQIVEDVTRRFAHRQSTAQVVTALLRAFPFDVPYEDFEADCVLVAEKIDRAAGALGVVALEVANTVFFRGKAAYLVGQILCETTAVPIAIALLHDESRAGICVDAVLMSEDEVSIVFSYTRSYFSVDTDHPRELVAFLHRIMPRKPMADLYIAIGHHKRAKTELYRSIRDHLGATGGRFDFVPGARGMVMIVFATGSSEMVFKVFRDFFAYPKSITKQEAMGKYQLVFEHDRAGRLVDAQEFTYLEFERERFSEALLEELAANAKGAVEIGPATVVIKHVYTERRVTPLDVYLRVATQNDGVEAVLGYGAAIRDLAATNIFPGDLLLKNFGVTRHGRVVFYDYDEISLVTDCTFRRMPEARDDEEEMSATPWFTVNPGDVFPEEFRSFLGLTGVLREAFLSQYSYLLDVDFWLQTQRDLRAGAVIDVFPYTSDKRLRANRSSAPLPELSPHA